MNKKKPIILAAAIILAVVTAVSASTFAWFTAQDEVVNKVATAKLTDGDVTIIETFDPNDRLEPGVAINKDVGAINTGDAPALVRISFLEVLKKLEDKGTADYQVRSDTMYVDPVSPIIPTHIPETVDITKFAATGWTELQYTVAGSVYTFTNVPGDGFLNTASRTAMETLLAKGITFVYKKTASTPDKYAWSAYACLNPTAPVGVEKIYQRVELRPELFNMVRDNYEGTKTPDGNIDVPNPNYGKQYLKVDLVDPAGVLYPAESSRLYNFITLQLANSGNPYKADWRKGGVPAATPVGKTHPDAPLTTWGGKMPAVTDFTKSFLELVFHSANVSTTITAGKWFYNVNDGFFYYIGIVEPGQSTPLLLDSISLKPDAQSDYSHMAFDLTVFMDAIQATKEAVTSTVGGGWGVNTYGGTALADTGVNQALATALKNLCPTL